MTNRGRESVRRVCVLQRLGGYKYSLADIYLLCESQIELTVVKTLLENIIERPPLKGWTKRHSLGALGELLIKLVLFTCLTIMFSLNCLSVYVF